MQKLVHFFGIKEVGEALTPGVFKFNQYFHEFVVILQLGVYDFNVLLVLTQQALEVLVNLLNALRQVADGTALSGGDASVDAFSGE